MTTYRTCAVPVCRSTTIKYPDKLFIHVPKCPKRRKQWLKLARRDPKFTSDKSAIFFCEDHFDLPNDMENYIQYSIMGSVGKIRMKPDCLPSKFECQPDRRKRTAPPQPRTAVIKRQRMDIIQEIASKDTEIPATSGMTSNTVSHTIEEHQEEPTTSPKSADKLVQVRTCPKSADKLTQVRTYPKSADKLAQVRTCPKSADKLAQVRTCPKSADKLVQVRTCPKSADKLAQVRTCPKSTDKSVQVHIKHKVRSKAVQTENKLISRMEMVCRRTCQPTSEFSRPLTSEEINNWSLLKEQTKAVIARVYRYLEQEYEELLKKFENVELTPLSKFRQRTALATGVSETTLIQILKEEEEQNAAKQEEPPKKRRRARKKPKETDSEEPEIALEPVHVNVKPIDYEFPNPSEGTETFIELIDFKVETTDDEVTEQTETDPILVEMKAEPQYEINSSETPALDEIKPRSSSEHEILKLSSEIPTLDITGTIKPRRKVKLSSEHDILEQHQIQGQSSTAESSSSVRQNEELDESGPSTVGVVKVMNLNINDEQYTYFSVL